MKAANMKGVLRGELVLAEMIANAEEHAFGFQRGALGVAYNHETKTFEPTTYDDNCGCAIGAYMLGKPSQDNNAYHAFAAKTRGSDSLVVNGNDADEPDAELRVLAKEMKRQWYQVGAAYRAYHEGES